MQTRDQDQLLVVTRKPLPEALPLRGRYRRAKRFRVRSARAVLLRIRRPGVLGVVVDQGFRDRGMDGVELALLLAEEMGGRPAWLATIPELSEGPGSPPGPSQARRNRRSGIDGKYGGPYKGRRLAR